MEALYSAALLLAVVSRAYPPTSVPAISLSCSKEYLALSVE